MSELLIILFSSAYIIISWYRRDYALLMIALLLPSYLIRFKIYFIPFTVLEIMILIVFLTWIIKSLLYKPTLDSKKTLLKNISFNWSLPVLLFIVAGIIAVVVSPDTRQALGLWKAYILEPALLYLVFINTIKTKKQIKMIVFGLGLSAVFISVVTIWQYIGWIDIPGDYAFEIPKRATSVFPFPTAVGKFVGPLLGLFLGLLLVKGNESKPTQTGKDTLWINVFLWGVAIFSIIALILSFSRGALIGVFIATLFISFFSKWKKWIFTSMAVSILLVLLIPVTRNSITDVFNTSDTSTDVHLVMWKGAVRIIKDNPITGTGLASFPIVYDDYKEASHTEYFPNPDHLILSLWIEMGMAGLIIFSWIVILFFRSGIKLVQYNRKWAVALLASMVVILVHGFMDTPYFKNDLSAMFWILIGLMVVIYREYGIDKYPEKK